MIRKRGKYALPEPLSRAEKKHRYKKKMKWYTQAPYQNQKTGIQCISDPKNSFRSYFAKLSTFALRGARNLPVFSYYQPDKDSCKRGRCKLCYERIVIDCVNGRSVMVNEADNCQHRVRDKGFTLCKPSKSIPHKTRKTSGKMPTPPSDNTVFMIDE